ncbi:MAG: hypothetical protein SGJ23_06130 [Alphaproteobacteria bacterium]|nr:hypothetical protein [Alphaproteobacteria bacterium]
MNFKDWSAVLGTWVSIAGALLGGYMALQAYQKDIEVRKEEVDKRADARVVQTFALYEQFQSAEMMRARNRLSAAVVSGNINYLQGQHDLFAYVDFFDAVQVCLEREICDRPLTNQLLGTYAKNSFTYVSRLAAETRGAECESGIAGDHPYAYGLEALATGTPPSGDCSKYPPAPVRREQRKSPDLAAEASPEFR